MIVNLNDLLLSQIRALMKMITWGYDKPYLLDGYSKINWIEYVLNSTASESYQFEIM